MLYCKLISMPNAFQMFKMALPGFLMRTISLCYAFHLNVCDRMSRLLQGN